jgi:hypothetical protein
MDCKEVGSRHTRHNSAPQWGPRWLAEASRVPVFQAQTPHEPVGDSPVAGSADIAPHIAPQLGDIAPQLSPERRPWPPRDEQLADWPAPWREAWGRRTNELIDQGRDWRSAESAAFAEMLARIEAGDPSPEPLREPVADVPEPTPSWSTLPLRFGGGERVA